MTAKHESPIGAILKGALAGLVGTAAMDLVWYNRYRKGGGDQSVIDWEFSAGTEGYENAAAPAQVGKRLIEGFFETELSPSSAGPMNNVVHWATGAVWGVGHGVLAGSLSKATPLFGLLTGAVTWSTNFGILARAGLYQPMWEYDAKTLWKDLSAHLVYGLGTGITYAILSRSSD